MTDSMVERVARAIAREVLMAEAVGMNQGHSAAELALAIDRSVERFWPQCVGQARAAIAEMREPTAEMVKAGNTPASLLAQTGTEHRYRLMIDAALKE